VVALAPDEIGPFRTALDAARATWGDVAALITDGFVMLDGAKA
jgi:hypothetical protein